VKASFPPCLSIPRHPTGIIEEQSDHHSDEPPDAEDTDSNDAVEDVLNLVRNGGRDRSRLYNRNSRRSGKATGKEHADYWGTATSPRAYGDWQRQQDRVLASSVEVLS